MTPLTTPESAGRLTGTELGVLFASLFTMAISNSFIFAILPPVGRGYGLTELQISLIVSPAALVFVIGSGLWGFAAERIGRKPLMLIAVVAAGLATVAFGVILAARGDAAISVSATFLLLMISRMMFGAFASGLMPSAQAYVADRTSHDRRARSLAVTHSGFAFGLICGPGLAAATTRFGVAVPFYIVGGFALAVALFVTLGLSEPRHLRPRRDPGGPRTPLRRLAPLLGVLVLVFTAYGLVLQVTGFRIADHFGMSGPLAAQNTGIALMVAAAGLVATQIGIARSRLPASANGKLLALGIVAVVIAVCGMGLGAAYWQLIAAMALFGIGLGAALPAALALLTMVAEPAKDQGRVGGFSAAAQGSGFIFGPPIASLAYQAAPVAAYAIGVILAAAALTLALFAAPRAYTGTSAVTHDRAAGG